MVPPHSYHHLITLTPKALRQMCGSSSHVRSGLGNVSCEHRLCIPTHPRLFGLWTFMALELTHYKYEKDFCQKFCTSTTSHLLLLRAFDLELSCLAESIEINLACLYGHAVKTLILWFPHQMSYQTALTLTHPIFVLAFTCLPGWCKRTEFTDRSVLLKAGRKRNGGGHRTSSWFSYTAYEMAMQQLGQLFSSQQLGQVQRNLKSSAQICCTHNIFLDAQKKLSRVQQVSHPSTQGCSGPSYLRFILAP